MLGPQQVPVQAVTAPSQQTGFIPPWPAQNCQRGMFVGALEGKGAAELSGEVCTSPHGDLQNTQFTQNSELCLTIFNTKNADGNCHLSMRCTRN